MQPVRSDHLGLLLRLHLLLSHALPLHWEYFWPFFTKMTPLHGEKSKQVTM